MHPKTPSESFMGRLDKLPDSNWFKEGAKAGSTQAFYRLNKAGQLVEASSALAQLLGYASVGELLSARRDFRNDLYADPGHVRQLERWLDAHGYLHNAEAIVLCADGLRKIVSEDIRRLRNDGEAGGEEGLFVHLDDRDEIEGAWFRSRFRYRTLIEKSQDGIFLVQDGRYRYVNAPYAQMLGYEPDELIGRNVTSFFAPGDRAYYADIWRRRRAGHWDKTVYETRLLHKDGREVPVSVNAGPMPDLGDYAALGTVRDLSVIHENMHLAEAAAARYRTVVRHASVGVYCSTPEGELIDANQTLVDMLGYDSLEHFKTSIRHIENLYVNSDRRKEVLARLEADGEVSNVELQLRRWDGSEAWFLETARVIRDDPDHLVCYEGVLIDITERKHTEEKLRYLATHDSLTGLPNREVTKARLDDMLETVKSAGIQRGAVLRVNLDVFKKINESLGYVHGDRIMQAASRRVHEAASHVGLVSRHGGDFEILAPDITGRAEAEALAERIEQALAPPFAAAGHEIYVHAVIGIALCVPTDDSYETVLRNADIAMMTCKRRVGRIGGHMLFDDSIRTETVQRLQLESAMRAGLERGEFEMHYQPICTISDRKIVGFEALVRWRHPSRGLLHPENFLSVAEETGLILELGRRTLPMALRDCVAWQKFAPGVFVSFNLSDQQFHAPNLVSQVTEKLAQSRLPPSLLHVEVTEDVFIPNFSAAHKILKRLHELGVKLYLDDFGTGYSGLSYLNELSFDALKIDYSFINKLAHDKRTWSIVRHTVTLAHELDMDVIAEGVEHAEEATVLADLNCRFGQGHLFAPALPISAVQERLKSGN